ncbi:MAG: sigma-70 family RNA polymerase sigma factor [Cytophagaceae bacterium]|nr:sigma-70 family RNA polymerase sigma factor [Cytophagaceae bacterium]
MRSETYTTPRTATTTFTEVEEMALWRAFKSGDQAAFARMYQRYSRVLYGYGFRVTHDAALIEDSIQDLFIELWRTRENLSDTTSIKFYLFRSLRRRISRTINAELPRSETNDLADYSDVHFPSVEALMIEQQTQTDRIEGVQRALGQLSRRQREVIALRFYHNHDYQEICSIMSLNYQSVCNLVYRALDSLRRQVAVQ